MANGGRRPGAGRKPGKKNTRSQEIANQQRAGGITPLEYMLKILRDEDQTPAARMEAAQSAAPFMHSRLQSIQHTGKDDGPIEIDIVEEVITHASAEGETASGAESVPSE
jgi:hypothetical protein